MRKKYKFYNLLILILIIMISVEVYIFLDRNKKLQEVSQSLSEKQNKKQVKVNKNKELPDTISIMSLTEISEGIAIKNFQINFNNNAKLELELNFSKEELLNILTVINNQSKTCNLNKLCFKITEEDNIQGNLIMEYYK